MIALLADANFRRAWLVGTIAGSLRWLELLVVAVYVLERTGSPFMVALMTVLRLAPMLVFGFVVGALGDRYERKPLLLISLAIMAASSLILAALALADQITLWQIAIGAFLNGVFFAVDFAVRRIISAEIAGGDRLGQAMALESVSNNATRMLGPLLGGVLLTGLGLEGAYLLGALLYLVSIVLTLRLLYQAEASAGRGHAILTELREGWRYARARRLIMGALAVTLVFAFWGFPYIAMVPVIGERVLGLPASSIGVLMSMEGLGALVGSLLVGRIAKPQRYGMIFLASTFIFLLGELGFGLSGWFSLSLLLNLIIGISLGCFSVMQSTILIAASRPEVRSRVMGLLTVSIGAGGLGGMPHLGLMADWLGAAVAVQLVAAQGLIALALVAIFWPELRRATDPAANAP